MKKAAWFLLGLIAQAIARLKHPLKRMGYEVR